jgi:hypothetical protein
MKLKGVAPVTYDWYQGIEELQDSQDCPYTYA